MFVSDVVLGLGDHEFEVLGFEDCCDGHAELEIHLPCDRTADPWRIVVSGGTPCLSCPALDDTSTCGATTDSAAHCGEVGDDGGCVTPGARVEVRPTALQVCGAVSCAPAP